MKKYFGEMDRATVIAQPLIVGMTELFVIVVARRMGLSRKSQHLQAAK